MLVHTAQHLGVVRSREGPHALTRQFAIGEVFGRLEFAVNPNGGAQFLLLLDDEAFVVLHLIMSHDVARHDAAVGGNGAGFAVVIAALHGQFQFERGPDTVFPHTGNHIGRAVLGHFAIVVAIESADHLAFVADCIGRGRIVKGARNLLELARGAVPDEGVRREFNGTADSVLSVGRNAIDICVSVLFLLLAGHGIHRDYFLLGRKGGRDSEEGCCK